MNDKNVKPHNSVADSLEAFRPYPARREMKQADKVQWLKRLKQLIRSKH